MAKIITIYLDEYLETFLNELCKQYGNCKPAYAIKTLLYSAMKDKLEKKPEMVKIT